MAKVFVGGYGTSEADILPIARSAEAHIATVAEQLGDLLRPAPPQDLPVAAALVTTMPDGSVRQWAVSATASSQYEIDSWSAQQASGSPNSPVYVDAKTAWAPSTEDGTREWLELQYGQAVVPATVTVHETLGSGFVTDIEAYDSTTETWVTLWQGTDPSPTGAIALFTPPLTPTTVAVDRIRVTIDTDAPDWNEIDAVELVGTPPN